MLEQEWKSLRECNRPCSAPFPRSTRDTWEAKEARPSVRSQPGSRLSRDRDDDTLRDSEARWDNGSPSTRRARRELSAGPRDWQRELHRGDRPAARTRLQTARSLPRPQSAIRYKDAHCVDALRSTNRDAEASSTEPQPECRRDDCCGLLSYDDTSRRCHGWRTCEQLVLVDCL